MAPPRLSMEVSLGHIAIIASLLGPVILFYADVTRTLGNHETRLATVEKTVDSGMRERVAFQNEVRTMVMVIREDIAGLKATLKARDDK